MKKEDFMNWISINIPIFKQKNIEKVILKPVVGKLVVIVILTNEMVLCHVRRAQPPGG